MFCLSFLFFALTLAVWPECCWCQRHLNLIWSFTGPSAPNSQTLEQCTKYQIELESRNSNDSNAVPGIPPYYLIAFRESGIPTTSFIGSDVANLSWTVNQPSKSTLLLTVIDSKGLSAGVSIATYDIADGDSSCLPSAPSVNITLTTNITKSSITTCDKFGLRVWGDGKKPYKITLAAKNSTLVTNITLGPTDDVATYINRADPNGDLLAAVSDDNGVWGSGSRIFNTVGTTDLSCGGADTTTGSSSTTDQHPKQPAKPLSKATFAAIFVLVGITLLLALGALLLWRRRRGRRGKPEPALLPDLWQDPSPSPFSPYDPAPNSKPARYHDDISHELSGSSSYVGMSRTFSSSSGNEMPQPSGSQLPPSVPTDWDMENEHVLQHRDGGPLLEIPPSYVDVAAGLSANRSSARSSEMESSSAPSDTKSSNRT